jgi:glycosyltransferase involved in cell wall biosynthesis
MRILMTSRHYLPRIGGLQLSVHQLALRLIERGDDVTLLTTSDEYVDARYPALAALGAKFRRGDGPPIVEDNSFVYPVLRTADADLGARAAIDRTQPDVVVAHVGGRTTLKLAKRVLKAARDIPSALYFRDVEGVQLLDDRSVQPNLVLTNAQRITDLVATKGWQAPTIPSIVETDDYRTDSSREVVLFINPRSQRKGVDIAWALATARPDVPFVFLEAWRFTPAVREELERRAAELPNVEVRSSVRELDRIYADAKVLFAPYEDSRPRVVAEAQSNGIPVLGTKVPGLVEAVGPGGLLVDFDAPIDEWLTALSELWDDQAGYDRYRDAALAHSRRDDMRPDVLAARFAEEMQELVRAARR